MAATLRTPSATPGCPVTVSGQNVTFAAWDLDWELYGDIVLDSWYLYNFTRSAGLVIHAKSGTEGGYTLTVTGDASAWVTGDTCLVLQGAFSAITTHATIAATITAMSANDTVLMGYVVSNRTKWQETFAMGVKPVNVYGHLSRQRCSLNGAVTAVGDQTANTAQVVWRNFTTFPGASNGCHYQDTGGTLAGGGVKWRRIVVVSASNSPGYGFYNQAAGANACRGEFCVAINASQGFRHLTTTQWYHCVAFWCTQSGFFNNNVAGTHQNCVAFACGIDFANTTNGSYTKCASSDTTGSEAGLRSLTMAQCSFWRTASNFFNLDMRITTASTLYNAGTAVAGLGTDIDGTTIGAGTCPIGCHSGTVNAYGVTWPTAPQVESGVSFINFAATVTGTADASSQSSASEASISESSASESSASAESQSSASESSASEASGGGDNSSLSYSSLSSISQSSASASSASLSESSSSESGDASVAVNSWEQYIRGKNQQVSIQSPTRTYSETGATRQTWGTTQTLWADIQDASPRTRARYSARQMIVDKSIFVAIDPACDQGYRVLYGAEYWTVLGVEELDKGKMWRIDAEKVY